MPRNGVTVGCNLQVECLGFDFHHGSGLSCRWPRPANPKAQLFLTVSRRVIGLGIPRTQIVIFERIYGPRRLTMYLATRRSVSICGRPLRGRDFQRQ
jgi:hypothetical protein